MTPYIKNHSSRNRYLLTSSGLWVRDFVQRAPPLDINQFTDASDHRNLIDNELVNLELRVPSVSIENFRSFPKCVIVSDGFGFMDKQAALENLPGDVCIIGVNRSLAKWAVGEDNKIKRRMDFYVVNNPYLECMSLLPAHAYRPTCITSLRTYPEFLRRYKGTLYYYEPTRSQQFGNPQRSGQAIDDYRNPLCAAVHLAYHFGVKKLCLFCCDDSFADERSAAEKLHNGLWMYPQHKIPHELVDGMLHWLKEQEDFDIEVVNHSSGPEYHRAPYISLEEISEFFNQ